MRTYVEDIKRLRAEGKTYREITEALGCAKSTVSRVCAPDGHEKHARRTKGHQAERLDFIRDYKLENSSCLDCAANWPPYILEFDHVPERGPKLFNLSQAGGRSWSAILAEIAKCDLVCANCHRYRTFKRLGH